MNLFRKHKKFEQQLHEQLGDMEVKPSTSLWDKIDSEITKDPFETGVQHSLENFEQMPYPETWAKIEAELPEPQVRGRFARYYVGVSLAVLFGVGLYIGNQWQSPAVTESQPIVQLETTSDQNIAAAELSISKDAVATESNEGAVREKNIRAEKTTRATAVGSTENIQPSRATTNVTNKEAKVSQTRSVLTGPAKPTVAQAPMTRPDKKVQRTVTPIVVAAGLLDQRGDNTAEGPASNPTTTETAMTDGTQARQIQSSANNNNNNGDAGKGAVMPPVAVMAKDSSAAAPASPQLLQAREVSAVQHDSVLYAQKIQELNARPQEEEFTPFSISVLAGVHLSFTTYGAPKDPGSLNFEQNIALRKELERPMIDWAGGFLVDYRLNKRWMLSSGVMMVNFNQKFEYSIEKAQDPNVKNEAGAPTLNPTDSFVVGDQSSDRIRYSWTEIPLFVNYTVVNKPRWNFDIQAGVSYAFINTIDAAMIGYDNKGVLLLRDKTSYPNIQNTVFVTAMPQLSYKFAPSVALGIAPTFKYSVTSIVGNDRWIQQHPYFVGVNVCLRKRF